VKLVAVAVTIICVAFGLMLAGLSIRANARFRHEQTLPMQWLISKSSPLSQTVIRSAPRRFALSLTPVLGACVLVLMCVGAATLTPRPGQEGLLLPSVLFIGSTFVAVHVLHLWMIEKTLHPNGGNPPVANVSDRQSGS
jgi:hypothetical protein